MLQRPPRLMFTLLMFLPLAAHAHPDGAAGSHALLQGVMHPLTGLDHLVFMLGLGLYAGFVGRRVAPWLGLLSLAAIITGAAPWTVDIPSAAIEAGVLVSLVLMGVALVYRRLLPVASVLPAAFMLSFVHGLAHGETDYIGMDRAIFIAGLVMTSGALFALASAKYTALKNGVAADRSPRSRM
jgi:urease accessory protein